MFGMTQVQILYFSGTRQTFKLTFSAANMASLSLNSGKEWPGRRKQTFTTAVNLSRCLHLNESQGTFIDNHLPLSWSDTCPGPLYIWARCGTHAPRPGSDTGFYSWHLVPSVSERNRNNEEKETPVTRWWPHQEIEKMSKGQFSVMWPNKTNDLAFMLAQQPQAGRLVWNIKRLPAKIQ